MSGVEWITFEELTARAPNFSARTLRRLIKDKQISARQRKRGAKLAFNWQLVERELAILDNPRAGRPLAASAASGGASHELINLLGVAEDLVARLRELTGRAA